MLSDLIWLEMQYHPEFLHKTLTLAQRTAPVIRLSNTFLVTGADAVREVFARHDDFLFGFPNEHKMKLGPFLLGMDVSPAYLREKEALHAVTSHVPMVADFEELVAAECANVQLAPGRIDVVAQLIEPVIVRASARLYGLRLGPSQGGDEMRVAQWLRKLGGLVASTWPPPFGLNPTTDRLAEEMSAYLLSQVEDPVPGGIIERLRNVPGSPLQTNEDVARCVGGLMIAGAAVKKASALALHQLLRWKVRVEEASASANAGGNPYKEACAAARARNTPRVFSYAWEALRFQPVFPLLPRYCPRATTLGTGTSYRTAVPANAALLISPLAAMFDPARVDDPQRFSAERPRQTYLHFGYGMHECLGARLAQSVIGALFTHLLSRYEFEAPGRLQFDGPAVSGYVAKLQRFEEESREQTPLTVVAALAATKKLPNNEAAERKTAQLARLSRELRDPTTEVGALLGRKTIHFLSFFVLPGANAETDTALVVLEVNSDDNARNARRGLVEHAPTFLREVFEGCEGLPSSNDKRELLRFLRHRDKGASAYYLAFPGRTVQQIHREQGLLTKARELPCDRCEQRNCACNRGSASVRWRRLTQRLSTDERVAGRARPWLVRYSPRFGVLKARVAKWARRALPFLVAAAGLYGWWMRTQTRGLPATVIPIATAIAIAVAPVVWGWSRWAPSQLSARERLGYAGQLLWDLAVYAFWAVVALGLVFALPEITRTWPLLHLAGTAAVGFGFSVLAGVYLYVLWGGFVGWLGAILLTGSWGWLVMQLRQTPAQLTTIGMGSAGLLAAIAIAHGWLALYRVRKLEAVDQQMALVWTAKQLVRLDTVQAVEDHGLQNHLATVSSLRNYADPRDRAYRWLTLRRVLRAVSLLARFYFNRGELGDIRTIHHARFVMLPESQRLLFLGNYDGAFGAYLQQFNDVSGASAIWSNMQDFPNTYFLVTGGARDEQRFKAFARRGQCATLGWYSAYPKLALQDIEAATATREDLQRRVEDKATVIGRLRRFFGEPMTEADCDQALRRL